MNARELKFNVDYVVKVDDTPFCKGTIVRRKLDENDDAYSVRFIAGDIVGFLWPDEVEEVPQGHPRKSSHYQLTLLQPIEIMQRTMTKDEFIGFIKGNIIKYSIRGGHKEGESPEKDLTKVNTYHRWLRLAEQGQMINPMID